MKVDIDLEVEIGDLDIVSFLTKIQGQNICYDMSYTFPMYQIIHCAY
jgi:hypothetical protein